MAAVRPPGPPPTISVSWTWPAAASVVGMGMARLSAGWWWLGYRRVARGWVGTGLHGFGSMVGLGLQRDVVDAVLVEQHRLDGAQHVGPRVQVVDLQVADQRGLAGRHVPHVQVVHGAHARDGREVGADL